MSTFNIFTLTIGLLFVVPSVLYLTVYVVLSIVVEIKKKRTLHIVPTELEGAREIRYDVPEKVLNRHKILKKYSVWAKLSMSYGCAFLAILFLNILVSFIKSM